MENSTAPGPLDGRVAIVTGGGSGIGRATVLALAAAGAAGVVVADIDVAAAEDVVRAAKAASGVDGLAVRCDVSSHADNAALVAAADDRFGALHVVHANAGIALVGQDLPTAEMEPDVWDRVIATNLTSVYSLCHAAIPVLERSGGGSIIATASSMGHAPIGLLDAYSAAKAGVSGLVRSMAVGCGPRGIRVNAISPGWVETSMTSLIFAEPTLKDAFAKAHITGLQTAEEIADTVVFLASDASRGFTGADLTVDRGWTSFKMPGLPEAPAAPTA